MSVKIVNNKYNPNFCAISAKPLKSLSIEQWNAFEPIFKTKIKLGLNEKREEIVIFKTPFKSKKEKNLCKLLKKIPCFPSELKQFKFIKDETADEYIEAYRFTNFVPAKLSDFERISFDGPY